MTSGSPTSIVSPSCRVPDTARGINEQPPTLEIAQALVDRGTSFESFGLFQGGGAPVTLTGPSGASRVEQMPVDVMLAAWAPVHRVTRIDPQRALRSL